jgi:peptidoglycan lytic transglycosylase G
MIRRLLSLGLLATALGLGWLLWYALTPSGHLVQPIEFQIAPGSSLKQVAAQLANAGVVDHPFSFMMLGRLLGKSGEVRAGSYLLSPNRPPMELLRKLTQGETLLGKITFIEGWNYRQLRQALDANPSLRHDAAGMSDAELLSALGSPHAHPEGLFFPDTYYFDLGSSDLALLKRAYQAMQTTLEKNWAQRQPGLPYKDTYEALIMASIIEKETGASDERPLIAAVFVNRLRLGMRLQTDPTVIYGQGDNFDGNLRKEDLAMDTPYNTYTRVGLPPTPICLPSADSIRAALNPEPTRALYFVAKGNGRHQFSDTLDEHNRAVARYQKGGR